MVSQLTQTAAAVVGVTLLGAGLAVGWTWMEPVEPSFEGEGPQELYGTRVFFETFETKLSTETRELPVDGEVEFDPLDVQLKNVTYATVTLHAQVDGVALRDEYDLHVQAPDGDEHEGSWLMPGVNANGYRTSTTVIDNWRRAPHPQDELYATTNQSLALALNAENHTETRSVGQWNTQLQVSMPGMPSRTGNASLTFTFAHYEAIATLLDQPPSEGFDSEGCREHENATDGCARSDGDNTSVSSKRLDGPRNGDASRTFIIQRGVASHVDRDPGPHGPL